MLGCMPIDSEFIGTCLVKCFEGWNNLILGYSAAYD
jgi:hypothetical protein